METVNEPTQHRHWHQNRPPELMCVVDTKTIPSLHPESMINVITDLRCFTRLYNWFIIWGTN